LYSTLFGQLSPEEVALPSWLVAVEGPLFEIPFAALVRDRVHVERTETDGGEADRVELDHGKSEYLVERNSVQIVPGAMSLRTASDKPRASGRMVAVGDPVYNTADPRWNAGGRHALKEGWSWIIQGAGKWREFGWRGTSDAESGQLSRLVGSGREVVESARAWGAVSEVVLTGTSSERRQFLEALAPVPAVIHIATHVLSMPQRPAQAFVAFSSDSRGQPEFLATSDVAKLNVPGALVIMTGCATATGDARGDAGLLGLTRAWLVAGASATIATGWPVPDSDGDLLPAFYGHWKQTSTAEALRRSQVDMIRAGGWRAAPSYWAAYQVTGGAR
jgi:CHAT domain-containing protein